MLVGRRHREGEVEIQEGEGMIAVEEAAEVGSRAQAERLALNSIGALSFLQGRKAEVVVLVVGGRIQGTEGIGERNVQESSTNGDI